LRVKYCSHCKAKERCRRCLFLLAWDSCGIRSLAAKGDKCGRGTVDLRRYTIERQRVRGQADRLANVAMTCGQERKVQNPARLCGQRATDRHRHSSPRSKKIKRATPRCCLSPKEIVAVNGAATRTAQATAKYPSNGLELKKKKSWNSFFLCGPLSGLPDCLPCWGWTGVARCGHATMIAAETCDRALQNGEDSICSRRFSSVCPVQIAKNRCRLPILKISSTTEPNRGDSDGALRWVQCNGEGKWGRV